MSASGTGRGLAPGYKALVVGSRGGLGSAFMNHLKADPQCAGAWGLGRETVPSVDFHDELSLPAAAQALAGEAPFQLIIVATGVLHTDRASPEKRLADLSLSALEEVFRVNVFGPALVLRHFAPLLDRQHGRMALLSAKVGSIGDNRLGGWYSYRASKAALNMVVRTAAIELRRTHPGATLAALHPGTVKSALSRPFRGDEIGRDAAAASADMLGVIAGLSPEDSGGFFAYDGQRLPW